MPFLLLGVGFAFLTFVLTGFATSAGHAQALDGQARAMATRFVAGAIQNQIMDSGVPPASLEEAAGRSGYQELRVEAGRPWQGYAVSPIMTDGVWQFRRAVVFSQLPRDATDTATYLADNDCGNAPFSSPGPWCGRKRSYWWLYDSRNDYANEISLEKLAQRRILQKFARAYSQVVDNRQAFPKPAGTSATLAALVGFGGTAGICAGSYIWAGVPLDCADLFSVWGTPRVYNYLTEDYVAILTTSTIKDATGKEVPVASQLDARARLFAQ